MTGCRGSTSLGAAHRRPDPAALAVALPVHRRLGAGLLHEGDVVAVGDRGPVDPERRQLDRVAGPLVVVGEALGRRADLALSALDQDHLGALGDRLGRGRAVDLGGLVGLDHLQQLQHRLVVLVLVGEQHLVDEAVRQQRIPGIELDLVEDLEGPLADLLQVGANLVGAQDRQLAADLARLLDRVVELAQVTAERLAGRRSAARARAPRSWRCARGPRSAG